MTSTQTAPEPTLAKQAQQRFLSLDVFRGLTVAGMILVNTPGSWEYVYAPLRHAPWNGCTPTDLVFPFFLFAVGNALSFSMGKYQSLGSGKAVQKILTRSALIFAIGLLLNWFPFVRLQDGEFVGRSFDNLRIFGVLQRIALAYLGAALIVHFLKPRAAFITGCVLLVLYWIILETFGDLTLEGNAVLPVDVWLVGEAHMYKGYFSEVLQKNIAFDPEGLLSTIPAITSVIFGFLAGHYIRKEGSSFSSIAHLFFAGLLLIFGGLCWDMVFPINKPIWSSSYVLYTTGLALSVLSMILFVVEMKGYRGWTNPFVLFGKNPLFIYVMSGVIVKLYFLVSVGDTNAYGGLYKYVFQPLAGNYFGSFLFALFHVALLLLLGWYLDKRRIYIRV
ncbi:MAG TPA: heparan-alpha-glucosaminide N-acetyltransferase domain-containing protein [Chryseosolibacter sp.]